MSGRDLVSRARARLGRKTPRMPASARQSQNVPVSYPPPRIKISPSLATRTPHLQGFCASPLTDSNRRPPPYHGGFGAVRAFTAEHRQARLFLQIEKLLCVADVRV